MRSDEQTNVYPATALLHTVSFVPFCGIVHFKLIHKISGGGGLMYEYRIYTIKHLINRCTAIA